MRRAPRSGRGLAGIALPALISGAACAPDSVVLVVVEGQVSPPITQLRAEVTVGTSARSLLVPPAPSTIVLPTSFSVQIPETLTGRLHVSVAALGRLGEELARAADERPTIAAGALNRVHLTLRPPPAAAP
jgi:hypothetical protein